MSSLHVFGCVSLSGWLFLCGSAHGSVVASTLPASRSAQTGDLAGVFATMINAGSTTATGCRVELATNIDADFYYQVTDPATNLAIGVRNTPVDIEAGQAQSFILGLTPNSEIPPTDVSFNFICQNDGAAPVFPGLNTLYFSASDGPVPDVIALAATASNDGIVDLPLDNQFGFLSIATVNLGSTATISVSTVATGASVSIALVCETDPLTAVCITELLPTIQTVITAGSTPTFSVFISSENEVSFDPANNRIAVTFSESGVVRGSTSIAIRGGGSGSSNGGGSPSALDAFTADISEPIIQSRCIVCHVTGGFSGTTALVFTSAASDSVHLTNNFDVFRNYLVSLDHDGSQILSRASGVSHGGGMQLPSSSTGYADLSDFLVLLHREIDSGEDTHDGDDEPDDTGSDPQILSLSKTTYELNEAIVVNYANLPGNNLDWLGTYVAGTAQTEYLQYTYSLGKTSGTMIFNGLPAGAYDIRLFYNDSYNLEQAVSFTVTGDDSGGADNGDAGDGNTGGAPDEVVFTIKQGTGSNAWNSAESPVVVEQGQTLVIMDADATTSHWLHSSGVGVCSHPDGIIKEGGFACEISQNATVGLTGYNTFHAHLSDADFFVLIVPKGTGADSDTVGQDCTTTIDWDNFTQAADLGCFESREDLLQNLPDRVRPNWVMMHTSQSNQSASIDFPRVLLVAPTGKFIVTFETLENSEKVEVAVFDFVENTWDFAGLTFEEGQPTEIETQICEACHTANPRPIWSGYSTWPGAVGDRDDIKSDELDLLNRVKNDQTSAIYKHLVFQNNYPLGGVLRPRVNYGENGNNQLLNFILARNAGRSLTTQVMGNNNLNQQQRLEIAYELACRENYSQISGTLSQYGYSYNELFGFQKLGDNEVRMWIGFNYIDFPAGILLLDALLKDDPQLAAALPELSTTLMDTRLKPLLNLTLADHPGWSSYDFGFQRDFYGATQASELSCAAMERLL